MLLWAEHNGLKGREGSSDLESSNCLTISDVLVHSDYTLISSVIRFPLTLSLYVREKKYGKKTTKTTRSLASGDTAGFRLLVSF